MHSPNSPESPDSDNASHAARLIDRVADVALPLMGAAAGRAAETDAEGWTTVDGCDFQIKGGTPGDGNAGDYYFADGILHIRTPTPITVRTAPTVDGEGNPVLDDEGRPVPEQTSNTIQIDPGVKAELTLAGVDINTGSDYQIEAPCPINLVTNKYDTADGTAATDGTQILHPTSLYLRIKDGTCNKLTTAFVNAAGIRCGEGSILTIDDELDNRTTSGKEAIVRGNRIVGDTTLKDGTLVFDSASSSMLESLNPGTLIVTSGYAAAGIGSTAEENGGTITVNGGKLTVRVQDCQATYDGSPSFGAGIGAGSFGDGTATTITINGGIIDAQGGVHGAGIGASVANNGARFSRPWSAFYQYVLIPDDAIKSKNSEKSSSYIRNSTANVAGDIIINGGFIRSKNGFHGAAFGNGCCSTNEGHTIIVTGGTLLPSSSNMIAEGVPFSDIGGLGGYVVITGGSIYCSDPTTKFQGIGGTAWSNHAYEAEGYNVNDPNDPNKVEMITIDLAEELPEGQRTVPIVKWDLTVDGVPQNYGAPSYLDEGKLYLWLPKSVRGTTVKVDMSYRDPATGEEKAIAPLFIEDAVNSGIELKRYVEFDLPENYTSTLTKHYDGRPLDALDLTSLDPPLTGWVINEAGERVSDDRELTDPSTVTYRYQHLRRTADGSLVPFGAEVSSGAEMPRDAGLLQFTMDSKQYANTDGFKESYWGHRATGQCEIKPIASLVRDLAAEWAEEPEGSSQRPGSAGHSSDRELLASAVVDRAATVDGTPSGKATAGACEAPEGRMQLYVDGEPAGDPIELVFGGTRDAETQAPNAERVDNGEGGSYTKFSYRFKASEADHLVPNAADGGRHEVSLRFLPPTDEQQEAGVAANYLASSEPVPERPEEWAEVVIDPIDPDPTVEKDPDSPGEVTVDPNPTPDVPGADPDRPGDKTYRGSITAKIAEFEPGEPNPGRVELKLSTPSSGPITIEVGDGALIEADLLRDDKGNPVRDENGDYTLYVDPLVAGATQLTVKQKPNGAYTGTTFIFDVTVLEDPAIAPRPTLAKTAAKVTHPDGPTQAGDVIAYTITAKNTAAGSRWSSAVASDPLPACLELVEDSVELVLGAAPAQRLTAAAAGAEADRGQYGLSTPDADGRRTLNVPLGDIAGGASATVTFTCRVRTDIDFATASAGMLDLSNMATATGTRPDPDDPSKPLPDPDNPGRPLPVEPSPTEPVLPPGPGTALPGDPAAGDIVVGKAVQNLTRPDESITRVGDRLRYTVTLENRGSASCVLYDAVISDPLPTGIEFAPGTATLSVGDGAPQAVSDEAFNAETRTLAVSAGNLWGGQKAVLTFECTVAAAAVGADIGNVAAAYGTVPSNDPKRDPSAPGIDPGTPTAPPGNQDPQGSSDPARPPTLVPDDADLSDIVIAKTAENTSRDDDTTHVGDTVHYEVTLENTRVGTSWMDVVIRDDVPRGLEPISGTIALTAPSGDKVAVDDGAYDPATRILAVACGHLAGGQKAVLAFDALVTEDAVEADIGNVACAYGEPASSWDPSAAEPEPGQPFDPPEGWDAWERSREKVTSDPAYPPGTDAKGGVINDDEAGDGNTAREKERATVAHKLAQTGDALAAAALLPMAAALAASALALASRRRGRRAR